MSSHDVAVVQGTVEDKPIFRNLMQLYRYDRTALDPRDPDPHGLFDYAYLDHYWTPDGHAEGRLPFLVKVGGRLAGFALKATHSYLGRADTDHNIAEFFVMVKWRRQGIGRRVAIELVDRFPGRWEVAVERYNIPAQAFWRSVIDQYANGNVQEIDSRPPSWDGPVQCFNARGL